MKRTPEQRLLELCDGTIARGPGETASSALRRHQRKARRLLRDVKRAAADRAEDAVREHFTSRGYDSNNRFVRPAYCVIQVRRAVLEDK